MSRSNTTTPAAVLIPIFVKENPENFTGRRLSIPGTDTTVPVLDTTAVLFTIRTHNVEHHKGQISFPGGMHEQSDRTLQETALRETEEEVGLTREHIQIVSELPKAMTLTSHFEIHPFVGIIRGIPPLRVNYAETEALLFVPLTHLLDATNQKMEMIEKDGVAYKIKAYHFEGHRIWGATARILSVLLA